MDVYKSLASYKKTNPSVITIGTFDGLHLGHKAILTQLVNAAKDENLESILLTFFPHPRMILQKDPSLKLINTIKERTAIIKQTCLFNYCRTFLYGID